MALRTIRLLGDEILTKPCREVTEMTPRLRELIDDMLETMYDADGVGLAAPQVGVLRQIVVIDIWQDDREEDDEDEEAEGSVESDGAEAAAGHGEPDGTAAEAGAGEPAVAEAPVEPDGAEEASEPGEPDGAEEDEDSDDFSGPLIMVNPVITLKEGEQTADEGCLSYPGKVGQVTRPNYVEVTYFDENMDEYSLEAEGLLARAICHEVDHLAGHMYVEFVEGEIHDAGYRDQEEDEESGEEPGEGYGDKAGAKAGEKVEAKAGEKVEAKAGEKAEAEAGEKAQSKAGDKKEEQD